MYTGHSTALSDYLTINKISGVLVNRLIVVLGETQQFIFPVKIDAAENVGTLKEPIKEKKRHAFQHVDADTLMLSKVSMPYGDLKDLVELPDGEVLMPVKKLSVIFPNHEVGENINIIIKLPPTGKTRISLSN